MFVLENNRTRRIDKIIKMVDFRRENKKEAQNCKRGDNKELDPQK